MRLHISRADALVQELDRIAGLEVALGSIPDAGHEWDDDPAEWVRRQRADRVAGGATSLAAGGRFGAGTLPPVGRDATADSGRNLLRYCRAAENLAWSLVDDVNPYGNDE
jgi:hypothetical protein